MKKRVCIIIPYFGKLPKSIITFLISCRKNTMIKWLIFTNDPLMNRLNNICKNVSFIKSNMNQMKKRLIKVTNIRNIVLDKPYKLCDYKPLYGKMFADYLNGYDYWGYSDLDVVYGNLWKYIKYGIIHDYKKIGKFGHFTLMHNDDFTNSMYKLPIIKNGHKINLFKDIVSQTPKGCNFDEGSGINIIFNQYHIKTYCNTHLVNEIIFPDLDLNTLDPNLYISKWQCYVWHGGHAIFFYSHKHKIQHEEYGYFHFQKRTVFYQFIQNPSVTLFSITTHGYNKMKGINCHLIKRAMKMNKSPFFKRLIYKIHFYIFTNCFATRMHIGKVNLPIKYILKSIFVDHNFRIFKI